MTFKIRSQRSIKIKICGITEIIQAKAIASLEIDAIGLIGVKSSPRYVANENRKKIFEELESATPNIDRVWVIANLTDQEIEHALEGDGAPSVIQLHGDESPQRCDALRKRFPNTKLWKALRIRNKEDLLFLDTYEKSVDNLLLDAWDPNELGGTGNRISLDLLVNINSITSCWIAGGISGECVPEILNKVRPYGIDASSKLELYPGKKDMSKVRFFVNSIRDN